jgi:hypothetical protein
MHLVSTSLSESNIGCTISVGEIFFRFDHLEERITRIDNQVDTAKLNIN